MNQNAKFVRAWKSLESVHHVESICTWMYFNSCKCQVHILDISVHVMADICYSGSNNSINYNNYHNGNLRTQKSHLLHCFITSTTLWIQWRYKLAYGSSKKWLLFIQVFWYVASCAFEKMSATWKEPCVNNLMCKHVNIRNLWMLKALIYSYHSFSRSVW